jgi:chemotaxis protein MotB
MIRSRSRSRTPPPTPKVRTVPRIIIKRRYVAKPQVGSAWKVAFADFATAMMAFFLMMWLMGATTADQRGGIAQYFNNPTMVQGANPLPTSSMVHGPGGASSSVISFDNNREQQSEPPKDAPKTDDDSIHKQEEVIATVVDGNAEREKRSLEFLKLDVQKVIDQRSTLSSFSDHILMDLTAEGLRIQVVDKERHSMFPLGSSELEPFGAEILKELASIIATVPNRVSISGHTDGRPYQRLNYSNWELSLDRANAARRALIAGGLPEDKIGRVVGLSTFAPLDRANLENPINRRISIIVLNRRTEQAILQESGAVFGVQTNRP